MISAGCESVCCPVRLGSMHNRDGYPLQSVAAAFCCEGSLQIVVNVDCNISRTEENLRIEMWHEVGHLAVYTRDPERYLQIHRAGIPKSLDHTALNLFELVPRIFSLAKEIPNQLLDLVLGDTFAIAAREIAAAPETVATVLARHEVLRLGVPISRLKVDLGWDGSPVQGEATESLAVQVITELQKLRESPKFCSALSLLAKEGAGKGTLGDLLRSSR